MKWRLLFILLVLTAGCMIIGGIHLAEKGIQRIDGIQDGPAQSFQIIRLENGVMEMTVLGREYSLKETPVLPMMKAVPRSPLPVQDIIEERNAWGNQIGQWLTSFSQKMTSWLTSFEIGTPLSQDLKIG